ncbi:MAG: AAA family ATPase, partial [Bacteroidia bacterium]|nr:AAA family ATPase [Bacteroidia bacterium]MDW8333490.1 AAA family ATPase [Bacteroidia bacterium]
MRLKTLEIQGFKSFADRTKFEFDDEITAIVGPNGCGKSNVIDAIRWVLGEQKTRNLRSDKMENVIFNGTEKRKKANLAEASITFENDRNLLPPAYTTVTITRRLYRDGESEYLLNNVPCRLKDIHHLFMDTGLGPDAYSIIELGMIEDMLNDKNNSRRALFEEAAGVAKYKNRRKETLNRLEEVDLSLNRVNDLLVEIEKNLGALEKQAQRAQQYFQVKNEYRTASERLAFLRAAEYQTQLNRKTDEDDQLKDLVAQLEIAIAAEEKNILALDEKLLKYEHETEILNKRPVELREKIKAVETEAEVRKERRKNLESRIAQLQNAQSQSRDETELLQARLRELETLIDAAN